LIPPDDFFYTHQSFSATAGQTVFTPTARGAGYITEQDWVFKNGVLLDATEYTETNTTVTLFNAASAGDIITIISFRSIASTTAYYEPLSIIYLSGTGTTTVTYTGLPYQQIVAGDILTFANTGTPTQYTVLSINYATKQIVFTGTFTATGGASIYRYRAPSTAYRSFSRWTETLTAASSYAPTEFQIISGTENLFLNGTIFTDQDYDLANNTINSFPAVATGNLTIFSFANNNLGVPNGTPSAVSTNTINGQAIYNFSYVSAYFELYNNGLNLLPGTDYLTATGSYTLVPTPDSNLNILTQATFNGNGAA
jgi:hypothetical protein